MACSSTRRKTNQGARVGRALHTNVALGLLCAYCCGSSIMRSDVDI